MLKMERCNQECCMGCITVTTYGSLVCTECGIERPRLVMNIVPRDWPTEPLFNVYSRRKRFQNLCDSLFFPTPLTKDNDMLAYLDKLAPFECKNHLLNTMKKSVLPDKRYSQLHLFCKLFTKDYTAPRSIVNGRHFIKRLLLKFGDTETAFKRLFTGTQFFNYMWLLQKNLEEFQLPDYAVFVKPLKCKARNKYYEKMYEKLITFMKPLECFDRGATKVSVS